MKQKILTLQQMHREGTKLLEDAGIEDASLDAWLLLSFVTGLDRAAYYGRMGEAAEPEKAERYYEVIERRSRRIPLQHITGEQEFMGYVFCVNEHVLIPRQDTETLVEEALKRLKTGMRILDVCTGSGCILFSILKTGEERMHIKGLSGVGTDISKEALAVAEKNACRLGVEADLRQGNLFENVEGKFDMILSNPPYIPTKVIEELQEEVKLHDPYIALDGKEDGLYFYKRIIRESRAYLKEGGCLLFEIGYDQAEAVSALMREGGYRDICVKKDLSGLDRVVSGM